MTKARLVALIALVGVVVLVVALMSKPLTVKYGPYNLEDYKTLQDLRKAETEVIVAGVFSAVQRTTPKINSAETISTYFVFDAKDVLWDPQHKIKGSSIIVYQLGGVEGRTTYETENDPLFQVNDQEILFLNEYEPGYYQVRAGEAGRFSLVNDQVMTIGNDGLTFDKPILKADFITMIRRSGYNN